MPLLVNLLVSMRVRQFSVARKIIYTTQLIQYHSDFPTLKADLRVDLVALFIN